MPRIYGPLTEEHKQKISLGSKGHRVSDKLIAKLKLRTNENHPLWVGNKVSYQALHAWVARKLGKPNQCENCNTIESTRFEWANISGEYRRDLDDWVRLCISCHHIIDGLGHNFNKGKNKKKELK